MRNAHSLLLILAAACGSSKPEPIALPPKEAPPSAGPAAPAPTPAPPADPEPTAKAPADPDAALIAEAKQFVAKSFKLSYCGLVIHLKNRDVFRG